MDIDTMKRPELLKALQTYKPYMNMMQKDICDELGDIENVRKRLRKLQNRAHKSPTVMRKSPTKVVKHPPVKTMQAQQTVKHVPTQRTVKTSPVKTSPSVKTTTVKPAEEPMESLSKRFEQINLNKPAGSLNQRFETLRLERDAKPQQPKLKRDALLKMAEEKGIVGRTSMTKAELCAALHIQC